MLTISNDPTPGYTDEDRGRPRRPRTVASARRRWTVAVVGAAAGLLAGSALLPDASNGGAAGAPSSVAVTDCRVRPGGCTTEEYRAFTPAITPAADCRVRPSGCTTEEYRAYVGG